MANKPWKIAERRAAALIGGKRHPANLGLGIDVESSWAVGQVKEVKVLSLSALTDLAMAASSEGRRRNKTGAVFVREHRGRGKNARPMLVVMTETEWAYLCGPIAAQ